MIANRPSQICGLSALSLALFASTSQAVPSDYFRIAVLDAETGRGVPLVELKTTHDVSFFTDSNGLIALNEPELMNQKVYFHIKSHGYEVSADGFGIRGTALQIAPGGRGEIKIKRTNIAERLYRITGAGIYRDSLLLGEKVPLKQPINALVMGQDTVQATPYKGKLFWLWGDTNRTSYPLGNFFTSSATSLLPNQGGLKPEVGVDLTYWKDEEGFSKKMMPMDGAMPVWLNGMFALRDGDGRETLFAKYMQVKSDSQTNEQGIARFNDDKSAFEKVGAFPNTLLFDGHPFHAQNNGQNFIYAQPSNGSEAAPLLRVRADSASVSNPKTYQTFTPLVAGSRYDKTNTKLERGADGKLVYAWKTDTSTLTFDQRNELVKSGQLKADESLIQLRDVETDTPIKSHAGSVFWNAWRNRWVMISGQAGGTSYLGEIWYAEADTPVGPWVYARKIVTHDKYTFYNPTQHPFFDADGGKTIYFEGTYTNTYSGTAEKTPRYDYNQMMYRLNLSDARLSLPNAVYTLKDAQGATTYAMREAIVAQRAENRVQSAPFFAVAPGRARDGLIPIYAASVRMQTKPFLNEKPLFYALPAKVADGEKSSPAVVTLWEYTARDGKRWVSIEDKIADATRSQEPLCRVWRNPSSVLALDFETKALP